MHLCGGIWDRRFGMASNSRISWRLRRCLISSRQQRCFYAHTTSEYVYIFIYTHSHPGTKIWDDTGNKNYNLCSRIPLVLWALVLWSCGQAPQDFASFPVENLLIYQPSTATFLQAASLDPLHNNIVNPDLLLESEGEV